MPTAKLKLRTPSEEAVAAANVTATARDVRGRVFTLRKPGMLRQYQLIKILGGETAQNEVYMRMILPIIWVEAIDGEAIPAPRTESELDVLIARIEEDGLVAIATALGELSGNTELPPTRQDLKNE